MGFPTDLSNIPQVQIGSLRGNTNDVLTILQEKKHSQSFNFLQGLQGHENIGAEKTLMITAGFLGREGRCEAHGFFCFSLTVCVFASVRIHLGDM